MNPWVSHVTDGCLVTVEGITEKIVRDLGRNRTHDPSDALTVDPQELLVSYVVLLRSHT